MWEDDFDVSTGQVNVGSSLETWRTFNSISHLIHDFIFFAGKQDFHNTRYLFNGNRFEVGWMNGLTLFCRYVEYDVPDELITSRGSRIYIPVVLEMFRKLTEESISKDDFQSVHYGVKEWEDEPFHKKVRPKILEFRNILENRHEVKNRIRNVVVRWLDDIGYSANFK